MARSHDREGISARLRYDILRRCNFACYYCGTPAALGLKKLQIDHVMPVDLGGTNDPWNLVAACSDCNAGKGATAPTEELVERVRCDYQAYATAAEVRAVLCRHCRTPVVAEYPDEDDPYECSNCDELKWNFYNHGVLFGIELEGGDRNAHPQYQARILD